MFELNPNATLLAAVRALADSDKVGYFRSITTDRLLERSVLLQARKNRMLFTYLSAISQLTDNQLPDHLLEIMEAEYRLQLQMGSLLEKLIHSLNRLGVEYLIGKTYKIVPYSIRDIDFLIREQDHEKFKREVKRLGGVKVGGKVSTAIVDSLPHLGPHQYKLGDSLGVDPYFEIPWPSLGLLRNDVLWKAPRRKRILDVDCTIPSAEADLLWLVTTAAFSDGVLTLLDFFYLSELLKVCNPGRISELATRQEVGDSVYRYCKILDERESVIASEAEFPYVIPLRMTVDLLTHSRQVWLRINDLSALRVGQNALFKILVGRVYRNLLG